MYVLFDHDIREITCTNLEYYPGSCAQVTLDQENYDLFHDVISRSPFPNSLRFRLDNNHWDTIHGKCDVDGFKPGKCMVFTILWQEAFRGLRENRI